MLPLVCPWFTPATAISVALVIEEARDLDSS
jgi:hypothetical protein